MTYIFTFNYLVSFPMSGLINAKFWREGAPCSNHVIVVGLLLLAVDVNVAKSEIR